MMLRVVAALAAVVLSGCAAVRPLTPEQLRAIDGNRCASFGFKRKSNDFAQCVMWLSLQRETEEAADRRAWMQSSAFDPPPYGIAEHRIYVSRGSRWDWLDDW